MKKTQTQRTQAQSIMGVHRKTEHNFKKRLIEFLKQFEGGFIDERTYLPSIYFSKKKGIPDVMFYHHGQTYGFETKTPVGRLSDNQKSVHKSMEKAGVFVFVLSELNFEAVKTTILERCNI